MVWKPWGSKIEKTPTIQNSFDNTSRFVEYEKGQDGKTVANFEKPNNAGGITVTKEGIEAWLNQATEELQRNHLTMILQNWPKQE